MTLTKRHRNHSATYGGTFTMRPPRLRITTVTYLTVGLVFGFLLGTWTRKFVAPCATLRPRVGDGEGVQGVLRSQDPALMGQPTRPHPQTAHVKDDPADRADEIRAKKNLVLIGVMTAKKFLNSRIIASYRTWAETIPGKVMFFSSEGSEKVAPPGLPVIALPGVNDAYPPQKKSFMMIKYMHDYHLNEFEYFMRADDDVYIRGDKLENFLHSINGSKALFIGQSGQGKKEEIGLLNLKEHENFCMGGPTMLFSRSTLARMVPHTSYCLKNLYTTHEDIEVGRCVRQFAGINCTWAFEMQWLFHNNYKEPNGSFTHSLKTKDVNRAITLHPFKNHTYQFRMHYYFTTRKSVDLRQKTLLLHREIQSMNDILLDRDAFYSRDKLGLQPSLMKSVPKSRDDVLAWEFLTRYFYSHTSNNPKKGLDFALHVGLEDIVLQVMDIINKNARQRGRTIDFKEILYGYSRVNPLHGADYVLDLLLVYRKHKGRKKMTVPVRRHAYLQQTFTETEFREDDDPFYRDSPPPRPLATSASANNAGVLDMLQQKLGTFYSSKNAANGAKNISSSGTPTIHFILPLAGRYKTFLQFMQNFEDVCLKQHQEVALVVMLYSNGDDGDRTEDTTDYIATLQKKYPHHSLKVLRQDGAFSRGLALQRGSELFPANALLVFIDVDIYMHHGTLERIVKNTRQGQQVYYPIVFSQYDPQTNCEDGLCPPRTSPFVFDDNTGYWRQFGFGIAAMYRQDLDAVDGFDTGIQGWGKEDVDLHEKFVKKNITVFRAVDPGMIHIFHPIVCNPNLDSAQYQMCLGSKAASYGAQGRLSSLVYKTQDILYRDELPSEADDQELEDNNQNNPAQPADFNE